MGLVVSSWHNSKSSVQPHPPRLNLERAVKAVDLQRRVNMRVVNLYIQLSLLQTWLNRVRQETGRPAPNISEAAAKAHGHCTVWQCGTVTKPRKS